MRVFDCARHAVMCGAVAALAACTGVPQPQFNVSPAAAASRMSPHAKSGDLLYVLGGQGEIHILSYPQGQLVATVQAAAQSLYLCSDTKGNVFVTAFKNSSGNVLEYAHGGTTPIASFYSQGWPWSCAVDPVTGNLAVVNLYATGSSFGDVVIFPNAQGSPTAYRDPSISYYTYGGYDTSGNLFIEGVGGSKGYFAELPYQSSTFINITLDHSHYGSDVVGWDGSYIALADALQHAVLRIQVAGSTGSVVEVVPIKDWHQGAMRESTFYDGRFIARPGKHSDAAVWKYPRGGRPGQVFHTFPKRTDIYGITVSAASNR